MKGLQFILVAPLALNLLLLVVASSWTVVVSGLIQRSTSQRHEKLRDDALLSTESDGSRRNFLNVALLTPLLVATPSQQAQAFPNKISNQYDDRSKRRGPQPKDLGVATRTDMVGDEYIGLKHCGGAPNCFCSTEDPDDDPDHYIPAWKWPQDLDKTGAFEQLQDVIQSYEPGQQGVDGGGFQIVKYDPKAGYLYVQFEALKNGYIDDFELAYISGARGGDRAVQVRSSSRVGYLDFGVNGKRVNYIANKLRAKGWDAPGVDYETHRNYAIQNEVV